MLEGATLIGRYRLDRLIGGDGRGGVFQATDLQVQRDIAVKVVAFAPGASREEAAARDRFRDHAATAARLRHPNVVMVHEVGTDEPLGLDFVVMELLQGEDLQRRVSKRELTWEHASRILHETARGLGAGHRLGLVHGGVSPANLFLERDAAGKPRTRVLDLGTRRLPAGGNGRRGGHPSGPLPYAAPEQRRGDAELTAAADVWGLAVAAFELLTGSLPFTEEQNEELARGVRVPPPPPSRLNHTVPPAADALIARSLSPHPGERPPDGEAFARELDAIPHAPRSGSRARGAPEPGIPVVPAAPAAPGAARKAPLPDPAPPAPSTPTPKRRRGALSWILGGGTVAAAAVLWIALSAAARREQKAEYFASARPIAPSRQASPGEIGYIREVFQRIENGGPGVREWRMELGRFPKFEWPAIDSAHATVYQDGDRLQKIRVRLYDNGARTALLFYYDDAGALVFVYQLTPSGGGRDAQQRFYFRDRALIRWRDTRNEVVPLGNGHDQLARMFLRVSDRLLATLARTGR